VNAESIGIAGAGTMGAGIAQLACLAGYQTVIHDPLATALARGAERVGADLERGARRGLWGTGEAKRALARLTTSSQLARLGGCALVIEAAPEELELKRELFAGLERVCARDAVLATNTSSLPVSAIAAAAERPERICGMHFFNPPALMKLVEVVATEQTGEQTLAAAELLAEAMGRTAVRCTDSPGFIVNRCNRPFTLESLQILGEGLAGHEPIDRILREDGGYPMGPFELIDLIGVDVNLEVARSFHRQRPLARWRPHPIQERMVAEGRLGRKSGRGFYDYEDGRPVRDANPAEIDPEPRREVLERVVAALINEGCFAADDGVAEPKDIDAAMRLGLNHPRGPFEWASELGAERAESVLDALRRETGDARYEVAPRLRREAAAARLSRTGRERRRPDTSS
jgi:3-hydroxybutyryl-CoA dehydrogenase